jgi:hypothetical protein
VDAECTYSFDFWERWEPKKRGVEAAVDGRRVDWHIAQSYSEPGVYVTDMVRYKTCGGKKEQIDVSCALVKIQ